MIVDDDRTMNSLLKTLLELEGFQVVLAPHGDMVLATALAEKPDAVLMDVHIADANGMDLLKQIRLHPHSGQTAGHHVLGDGHGVRVPEVWGERIHPKTISPRRTL